MGRSLCVAALLALCVCAQAQKTTDVAGALKKAGLTKAGAILDIAGVTDELSNPKAKWTFLAPTDAAVDKYLKDMGLTVADLKARPALARDLVKQHLVLGSNLRAAEIFDTGAPVRVVPTLAGRPNHLLFKRDTTKDGKERVTITDHQSNVALVKGAPLFPDDNKTVHVIDHVLWSDRYYPSTAAICRQRRFTLSDFCAAVAYAGLGDALKGKDLTLFVPNNAAIIKARVKLGGRADEIPKPAEVAALLKLHAVEGVHELGHGEVKDGKPLATLAGVPITPEFEKKPADPKAGQKLPYAEVEIKAPGSSADVVSANIHVGKIVAHGIDAVLLPKGATPEPKAGSGRKLLGWGWGLQGGGTTAEEDDAESAIDAAASGYESTADAAQQSVAGAEALSVPGAYNLVNEGVLPW
jgi:uncharacterized surface protein with fasciclin (FAS1) repeats